MLNIQPLIRACGEEALKFHQIITFEILGCLPYQLGEVQTETVIYPLWDASTQGGGREGHVYPFSEFRN